jgi:hypothetical protein
VIGRGSCARLDRPTGSTILVRGRDTGMIRNPNSGEESEARLNHGPRLVLNGQHAEMVSMPTMVLNAPRVPSTGARGGCQGSHGAVLPIATVLVDPAMIQPQ